MKRLAVVLGLGLGAGAGVAQGVNCNMLGYKAADGLRAEAAHGGVTVTWQGEGQQELRAGFALRDGQPVVAELAARKAGGSVGGAGQRSVAGIPGHDGTAADVEDRRRTF